MTKFGKVKDIEIDPDEMKVTHLILELEKRAAKELLGKKIVFRHSKGRVASSSIANIGDAVVLKQSIANLKGVIK